MVLRQCSVHYFSPFAVLDENHYSDVSHHKYSQFSDAPTPTVELGSASCGTKRKKCRTSTVVVQGLSRCISSTRTEGRTNASCVQLVRKKRSLWKHRESRNASMRSVKGRPFDTARLTSVLSAHREWNEKLHPKALAPPNPQGPAYRNRPGNVVTSGHASTRSSPPTSRRVDDGMGQLFSCPVGPRFSQQRPLLERRCSTALVLDATKRYSARRASWHTGLHRSRRRGR